MNDILLTPIRLNELEALIQNSVRKVLSERSSGEGKVEEWFDINTLREYHPERPALSTIYSWVNQREIPFNKRGKKLYFLKSEIDRWLKSGRKKMLSEIQEDADKLLVTKNKRG